MEYQLEFENVLLSKEYFKRRISASHQKSQAIRELERLSMEKKRLKYPNNPYLVVDSFRDDSANGLTKAIIAWLSYKGNQAERINTTGRPIDRTKTFTDVIGRTRRIGSVTYIKGTGTNGSADISATINGKSVKIEVKIGSDRQSQAQEEYQGAIEQAGGLYFIARTFDEFVKWYYQNFML